MSIDYLELVGSCHESETLCTDEKFWGKLAHSYGISKAGFLGQDSIKIKKNKKEKQFQIAQDYMPYLRYLHVLIKNVTKKELQTLFLDAVLLGYLDVVMFIQNYADVSYLLPLSLDIAKDKSLKSYLKSKM